MEQKANRSLYLFLCAIMGALLFVIVHRTIALVYYMVLNDNFDILSFGLNYYQINLLDYFSLIGAMILGIWYGIWLGQYWYSIVYEHGYFSGVVHHILNQGSQGRLKTVRQLKSHIDTLQNDVAQESFEIEELAQELAVQEAPPKKKSVRKMPVKRKTLSV